MKRFIPILAAILALAGLVRADAQATQLTAVPVQVATLTLPSAQILTAQTIPVTFIPAPPTGSVVQLLGVTASLAYKSATYSSTACGLYFHGTTQLAAAANLNTTVDGTASVIAQVNGLNTGNIAVANAVALAVDFACTTGNPTTGDSALKLVASYVVVPL